MDDPVRSGAVYNPKAAVRVPLTIRVRKAIKPERARAH